MAAYLSHPLHVKHFRETLHPRLLNRPSLHFKKRSARTCGDRTVHLLIEWLSAECVCVCVHAQVCVCVCVGREEGVCSGLFMAGWGKGLSRLWTPLNCSCFIYQPANGLSLHGSQTMLTGYQTSEEPGAFFVVETDQSRQSGPAEMQVYSNPYDCIQTVSTGRIFALVWI